MNKLKEKSSELLDDVNRLVRSNFKDEMSIRRLKRDAKKLLKTHPSDAYSILGMLASIEGKLDEVRENHRCALNLEGSFLNNINFATALFNLGSISESLPYYQRALEIDSTNLLAIAEYADALVGCFRFREAAKLKAKLDQLQPDNEYQASDEIKMMVEFFEQSEIEDDDAELVHKTVFELLNEKGRRLEPGSYHALLHEDDQSWIEAAFSVSANNSKDIVDLNFELSELVAEKVKPSAMNGIVARFILA